MRVESKAFRLQKAGNAPTEYEDARWPREPLTRVSDEFRAAVSDGATETSFSKEWANLLVRDYCRGRLRPETLAEVIPALRQRWRKKVSGRPLPWYAEQKLAAGAFASLTGVTLQSPSTSAIGTWTALAIGDSCLFQLRGDKIVASFPMQDAEEFNSRPLLLSSVPSGDMDLTDYVGLKTGEWRPGDEFYLMTDALACWFLRRWSVTGRSAIETLRSIDSQHDFGHFIDDQRQGLVEGGHALKNDDVTLVALAVFNG